MIKVINTQGAFLHETYAKRAKGLVKKGRARYVNEQTICLLSPAMEDNDMEITKEDILHRIDQIVTDTAHIKEADMLLERLPYDLDAAILDIRVQAIKEIVKEREETNRKIIDLLQQMLPKEASED